MWGSCRLFTFCDECVASIEDLRRDTQDCAFCVTPTAGNQRHQKQLLPPGYCTPVSDTLCAGTLVTKADQCPKPISFRYALAFYLVTLSGIIVILVFHIFLPPILRFYRKRRQEASNF